MDPEPRRNGPDFVGTDGYEEYIVSCEKAMRCIVVQCDGNIIIDYDIHEDHVRLRLRRARQVRAGLNESLFHEWN